MIDAAVTDNIRTLTDAKAASSNKSGASQKALDKTFDDFLVLLTTQLKNQDPLDPQDSSEFTSQLAQMSSVQEQVNTNTNLEKLISVVSGSQLSNVVNYIGRAIEADGNQSMLIGDDEIGRGALFVYDLDKEAASTTITITDQAGSVIYTGNALGNAGRNEVVWDGRNSMTGQIVPNGAYKFTINAKDYAGNKVDVTTYTTGIVTAVDMEDGAISLSLGGSINININDVTAIRTAQELL